MLRVRGRIAAPLDLEDHGLHPVISFDARTNFGDRSFDYEHILPVTVDGEFPSGFAVDLRQPPPPPAMARLVGGEPAYAQGHLMVVGPDFPEVVSVLYGSSQPTPECSDEMFCIWGTRCEGPLTPEDHSILAFGQLPPDRACLSRLQVCTPDESGICTITRDEGDPKLRSVGYASDVDIVYFAEPIEADTHLAMMYNGGNPITAGYHAYLPAQLPTHALDESLPSSRPCFDQAEAVVLAEYNAEHGTNHLSSGEFLYPFPADDPSLFEYYEWQRAVYREMRKLGCADPYFSPRPELGPDDLIEITLDPSRPPR